MTTLIFKNAHVEINSKDLSDHVKSVTLSYEAEMQDDTAMGDDTRSNKAGLKNWSVDIEFLQDYEAEKVDATLFPLVGADAFPIILKPNGAVTGPTNPAYTGTAVLPSYTPMGGTVGDLAMAPVNLVPGGATKTLDRSTTP